MEEVGAADVVETDLQGRVLAGRHSPSSELAMHLAIFHANPRLAAVVHTHSPHATAFAVLGRGLSPLTTEAEGLLGEVPVVPFAGPGTPELAVAVGRFATGSRAVLMERHGVVAWGGSLREAFYRAELVEETARVTFYLQLMKGVVTP